MSASPSQAMLFDFTQTKHADGSITLRPHKARLAKDVSVSYAARYLGLHRATIYRLCELGESCGGLDAWKTPSVRGNAKWRIIWESVASYRERTKGGRF